MTKSHDPAKEEHNRRSVEQVAREKLKKADDARQVPDPAQAGYGLPQDGPLEARRSIVFRPGALQYAYCLWAPVLCIGVGVALVLRWNVPGSVGFGVLFLVIGLIPASSHSGCGSRLINGM